MTVMSRAGIISGNQNAAPTIPMSARALDGVAILAPPRDALSASYLRADVIVDQWVARTLIDSNYLPDDYDYDAFEDQVYNMTAGTDYRQWCVSEDPIFPSNETYYFEVATLANTTSMDGYIGVIRESLVAANFDAGENPIMWTGSVGYRGLGTVWNNGAQAINLGGGFSYGNGTLVRIAFNASTGEVWFGRNGTWHRNPESESASFTFGAGDQGVNYRVALQCRNPDERAHLRGRLQQFRYDLPAGCIPLKS